MAGNGPNILQTLQKTHPKLNNAQEISFGAHSSASLAPSLRDDRSDRPCTAPSQDSHAWLARERSDSLEGNPVPPVAPVPPPKHKQRPPYRLPDKQPEHHARQGKPRPPYRLPDKVCDPLVADKPLPPFRRERSSSIRSSHSGSTGVYVDLLDAHAGFYPTNFRQRVRATGARDYGEDVADRNLGANNIHAHVVEDQARSASRSSNRRTTSSAASAPNDQDETSNRRSTQRYSLGSSLRAQSMRSDAAAAGPTSNRRPAEPEPPLTKGRIRINDDGGEGVASSIKAVWRNSLPSAISSSRKRREQEGTTEFPEALTVRGKAVVQKEYNARAATPSNQMLRHHASRTSSTGQGGYAESADLAGSILPAVQEPVSREVKAARRRSMVHSAEAQGSQMASKRLSLQNMRLSSSDLEGTEDEVLRVKPRSPTFETPTFRRPVIGAPDSYDVPSTAEFKLRAFHLAKEPSSKRSAGRERLGGEDSVYSRSHVSGRALAYIESDEIPERTSSMRKSSMDSTSATSQSSNPFRPQSRHTANTSIDLSPFAKEANLSRVSLGAASHRASPVTRHQSPLATTSMSTPPKSSHKPKLSSNFNIDDHLSSDDDFEAPRNPRGEGEEHLLFQDTGFAFSGMGLPGISGSIDDDAAPRFVPGSPPRKSPKRWKAKNNYDLDESVPERYRHLRIEPPYNAGPHRSRRQMTAYRYEDSDSSDFEEPQALEEESEDEISFDIPMTRRSAPLPSYRPTRYASREQVIEEEREYEKPDLATAMRLRKEEKRRKRLSGASGSTIRTYSNSAMAKPHRYDVAGFDAKAE